MDASDIVQQTCMEGHRDFAAFRGQAEGELLAWLRRILEHNAAHTIERHVYAQKRTTSVARFHDFTCVFGGMPGKKNGSRQTSKGGPAPVPPKFAVPY